jgi:hypothetical protein
MAKVQDVYTQAARSWSRRVCYPRNQRWMQTTRAGRTAVKEGKFKDEQTWGKQCSEDLECRDLGEPATTVLNNGIGAHDKNFMGAGWLR